MGEAKRRKLFLGENYGRKNLSPIKEVQTLSSNHRVSVVVHKETYKDSYIKTTVTDEKTKKSMPVIFHCFLKNEKLYAEAMFVEINEVPERSLNEAREKLNLIEKGKDDHMVKIVGENINFLSKKVSKVVTELMSSAKVVIIS